ncbi:MAG: hypothetical protein RML94_01795 [Bacteroidia bacterium]|nr:hypothetical protein [Bacteroidia bacterium]
MSSKEFIIQEVINFYYKYDKLPSFNELKSLNITRDKVRNQFSTLENLYDCVSQKLNLLTHKTIKPIPKNFKHSKYVITTAVANAKVNKIFLKLLELYCFENNAQLLIIPQFKLNGYSLFDIKLTNYYFVVDRFFINSNCQILNIQHPNNSKDPTVGIASIGTRYISSILPSSIVRLKYVAMGLNKFPHAIMTTGAITENIHKNDKILTRSSFINSNLHTFGAVVVEVENNEFFHFRQIIYNNDNVLFDLGKKYSLSGVKKCEPILVLGDWHVGKTNLAVKTETIKFAKKINAKKLVLHDVFDAYSISHHDTNKMIVKAKKAQNKLLSLEYELDQYINDLKFFLQHKFHLIIVKSNHDEHLERYIEEVRFKDDPINFFIAANLVQFLKENKNPLKEYTLKFYPAFKKLIKWLNRDESFKFGGVELGAHGDKGANGSFPSLQQLEGSYGDIIIGHRHTPEIKGRVWVVGTSTDTRPDYGNGPSSWMNTHCIVYPNGTRQLVNFINGKFFYEKFKK